MSQNPLIIRSVAWLSIFKFISQIISWTTTIFVARILTAKDYGLMEMATIFTGYIDFFVEFGIGTALINKKDINKNELSSMFWFMFAWGTLLAASCLLIAPLTALYFKNPTLEPITLTVGILFIITSLIVIPRSLLHREMRFKEIGAIDALSIILSCIAMLLLAKNGAGVWTLLLGTIIREVIRLFCLYFRVSFRPTKHFSFNEISPFIKFGFPVVASNSLYYIYNKSDRFFGGRVLGETQIGFYALALQLAAMPVEKIVSIFQSAIFPALSKIKENKEEFNKLFLSFSSILYSVVLPLFVGGYLLAEEVILLLLSDPKWIPTIIPFKILLIAQTFVAIGSPLALVHNARGKPSWSLYANSLLTPCLFLAFYFSANQNNLNYLAIPWVTIYPIFVISYLIITLRTIKVPYFNYLNAVKHPIFGTVLMTICLNLLNQFGNLELVNWQNFTFKVIIGAFVYLTYFFIFGRNIFKILKEL